MPRPCSFVMLILASQVPFLVLLNLNVQGLLGNSAISDFPVINGLHAPNLTDLPLINSLHKPSLKLMTNNSLQTWHPEFKAHCSESTQNLVLSYFSGKFDIQLFNIFVRSLRATGCTAVIVVLIHGFEPSQKAIALGHVFGAQLLHVPDDLFKDVRWSSHSVMFRFRAWRWYLDKNHEKYSHVLNSDMDVFFQADPFLCFFGDKCDSNSNVLHSFSENPAVRIGECHTHRNWYLNGCAKMGGSTYFQAQREKMRICAGFSIGGIRAFLIYLKAMEAYIFQGDGRCNDQAIHNILIWGNLLTGIDAVYVWDYFSGPVKTIDTGYLQDEFDRIINDNGAPYCVIHQYKGDRNPQFVQKLKRMFPLNDDARRVHWEDTRFPPCTRKECKGLRVHSSVNLMIEKNISGGWRGPLPKLRRIRNPLGPLPSLSAFNGYKFISKIGAFVRNITS